MTAEYLGAEFNRDVPQPTIEARYCILHVVKQLIFVMSARRIFGVQIGNAIAENTTLQLGISLQAIVFHSPGVEQPLQVSTYRVLVSAHCFPALGFVGMPAKP